MTEKTAAEFLKRRQSRSDRYKKSLKRGRFAKRGFGGSTKMRRA